MTGTGQATTGTDRPGSRNQWTEERKQGTGNGVQETEIRGQDIGQDSEQDNGKDSGQDNGQDRTRQDRRG